MMSSFFNPIRTHFGFTLSAVPLPAPPAILRSDGSLAMGSTSTGSPGTEKTFTVEGTNLTGDIVVVGSTNIEVSLTTGAGFGSSVSVSPSGGTVASTTIYTRIKSGATAGAISENIYSTSAGSAGYATLCTGTVTSGPSFPSSGLVAYWSFDDTLTDTVGSKVLTASGGNSYVAGKLGTKALQLTATNGASITDGTVAGYFTGACSFQIWAKIATLGASSYMYFLSGDDCSVWYDNVQDVISLLYDISGSGYGGNFAATITADTWYHLVVTSDGGTSGPKVYLDGTLLGQVADVAALGPSMTTLQLGQLTDATHTYDAVAIWNRELTPTEVTDLYNSGSGVSP